VPTQHCPALLAGPAECSVLESLKVHASYGSFWKELRLGTLLPLPRCASGASLQHLVLLSDGA
jgi:hypothetical protein